MMETLWQDLSYGLRLLGARPGFTAIAVLALALGIGANTAIFSLVNSVLLQPLPYRDAGRLVTFLRYDDRFRGWTQAISPGDLHDCQSQSGAFADAALVARLQYEVIQGGGPQVMAGAAASPNLFTLLGIKPMLGRLFLQEDGRPESEPVAVLSHSYWLNQMGADPQVIGKKLNLSGTIRTVIGVLPADFKGTFEQVDWGTMLWTPDALRLSTQNNRRMRRYIALAHLKSGVSIKQAQREMAAITERLAREYPETNAGVRFTLQSLHEKVIGDVRAPLLILVGAVGLVLLIACANVANLLLTRSLEREKEMALRAALGASRWRVVQQLLTESMLLSMIGGLLGMLLAVWSVNALRSTMAGVPRADEIHVDLRALGFTLAISLMTGVVFGALPAWQAAKLNLTEKLKDIGQRATAGRRSRVLRHSLVVAQISLSLVLLTGAGLMLNSLIRLWRIDPGFKTEKLLCTYLELPRAKPDEARQAGDLLTQAIDRARALPGIQSVAMMHPLPLGDSIDNQRFRIEGRLDARTGEQLQTAHAVISPDYFSLLGLRLLRGRLFTKGDTLEAPAVIVINEAMARTYWPNQEPLGQRIVLQPGTKEEKACEVVGVVSDARQNLIRPPSPQFFQSYLQASPRSIYLVARTSLAPQSLAKTLREAIQTNDRHLVIGSVRTMEEAIDRYFVNPRFYATLFSIFAAVALLLALVGIYGVMSYTVVQRTHEIGVRIALGAQTSDVLKLVMGQGMLTALIGLVIGVGAALMLTRMLTKLVYLYGVSVTDPVTFLIIATLFALAALLACYLPARRATKVDPMVALRNE
jgi:putative ABC transport system permease protein